MNFQGLHRTIQFSISSLTLGKRQKHNISHFFNFANHFLKFFRFFQNRKFSKFGRFAKVCVLYQPRCTVVFDAQQKHNISHFFNFANRFLKFFRFFSKPEVFKIWEICRSFAFYISLATSPFKTRNRNIIYHRFEILQTIFGKNLHFFSENGLFSAAMTPIRIVLTDCQRWNIDGEWILFKYLLPIFLLFCGKFSQLFFIFYRS